MDEKENNPPSTAPSTAATAQRAIATTSAAQPDTSVKAPVLRSERRSGWLDSGWLSTRK